MQVNFMVKKCDFAPVCTPGDRTGNDFALEPFRTRTFEYILYFSKMFRLQHLLALGYFHLRFIFTFSSFLR